MNLFRATLSHPSGDTSFTPSARPTPRIRWWPAGGRFRQAARQCLVAGALALTGLQLSASILAVQISDVAEETGVDQSFGDGSDIMEVMNGTVDGLRVPFVSGRKHTVTIWGDFVDWCDRVEIRNNKTGALAAISGKALTRSVESSASWVPPRIEGKGKLTFTLPGGIIPGSGTTFDLCVRYSPFGTDTLECRGIRRLVIDSATWVGPFVTQPTVTPLGTGEASLLRPGVAHSIRLHTSAGLGFINNAAVKFGYGGQPNTIFSTPPNYILSIPVTSFTVNSTDPRFLTVNFMPLAAHAGRQLDRAWQGIRLTDAAQPGGHFWGEYIFHRFKSPLPTAGASTDLARVTVAGAPPPPPPPACPGGHVIVNLTMPEPTPAMLAIGLTLVEPANNAVGVGTVSRDGTGVVGVVLKWDSFNDFAFAGFSQVFPMAELYEVVVTAATTPPGFAFTKTLANSRPQLSFCSQTEWTGDPEPGRAWWLGVVGGIRDGGEPVIQFALPNLRPGTTYNWSVRAVNRPGLECGPELNTPCRTVVLGAPMPAELLSPFAAGTFTTAGTP